MGWILRLMAGAAGPYRATLTIGANRITAEGGLGEPVGLTAARGKTAQDIESATQITTASDLKNRRYYFHTMNSREVRMIDLAKIDFGAVREQMIDGDEGRRHTVREITIRPSGAVR